MNKKILFFDIDGTLLDGGFDGFLPQSAVRALTMAQKNGHYLFINSGRTYNFMPQAIKDFPFDGYLCGCGTEIIFRGQTLYHHNISKETTARLLKALKQTRIQGVMEGDACYYDDEIRLYPPILEIFKIYAAMDIERPLRTFRDPEIHFDKFVTFHDENSDFTKFLSMIGDDFDYIPREGFSVYGFSEFVPKGHSKATAIDFMVRHLGLSLDDCYAFGDSNNDLPMLSHVKHSVAMGNSVGDVFGKVEYITTPIDRDGIMLSMKHYGLCE